MSHWKPSWYRFLRYSKRKNINIKFGHTNITSRQYVRDLNFPSPHFRRRDLIANHSFNILNACESVWMIMRDYVCVCVWVSLCVCVYACVFVCLCVRVSEVRVCVCASEWESVCKREIVSVCKKNVREGVSVCARVCLSARKRGTQKN